jgi:hypothetical protein
MKGFLSLLFASVAVQAQGNITPTLSGFLYNAQTRSLHAMRGVPGSAYVGSSALAENLDGAWPAPAGAIAVVIRAGGTLVLRGLDQQEPQTEDVSGLLSDVSGVVWSPAGTAALLAAGGQVQVVRFADGRTRVEPAVETAFLGDLTAMAVNDAGEAVVAAGEGVYALAVGGNTRISDIGGIRKLRFGNGGYLYMAAADRLWRVNLDARPAEMLAEGIGITDFAVSRKSGWVYVTDSSRLVLEIFDAAGKKVTSLTLDRAPAKLDALVQDSLFLLNAPETGRPAIVLQTGDQPAVLFIPAEMATL